MRRVVLTALLFVLSSTFSVAENPIRLEGIAYAEGGAKTIDVQVWALGEQVREHPEWQIEPVFAGSVVAGKAFSVELGEARLPVQVELAAEAHVAVALQVVIPEQLKMTPAWLRRGEPIRIRVSRPGRGQERAVLWGTAFVNGWDFDNRRWKACVPHLEVPADGLLTAFLPGSARTVSVTGVSEGGAYGSARSGAASPGRVIALKIDSEPLAVRVWDERDKPAAGIDVRAAGAPVFAVSVTDEEGRTTVQVPPAGWRIAAIDPDSLGLKAGRGTGGDEIDVDLGPKGNLHFTWPGELGELVVLPASGDFPRVASGGEMTLPRLADTGSIEYWGPGIAPGRVRYIDPTGSTPLVVQAPVRIKGEVVSPGGSPVAGLPVWMRIARSAMATGQRFGPGGREAPLESAWLPWAVTDARGMFTVEGMPVGEFEAEVRATGFPATRSERLPGKAGASYEVTISLVAGAALDLRVVDPNGAPLPGAVVDLYREEEKPDRSMGIFAFGGRDSRGDPESTAAADEAGQVSLEAVPVGSVKLRLSRPGSVTRVVDGIEVPPEGADIGEQVLQPGVAVAGTTVGPDGEPVGEAEVALERSPQAPFFQTMVTSDEDGRFEIPDLEPEGTVYLWARADGFVPDGPLKVELPPDAEVEVSMAEEQFFEGVVLDARDDTPVEGAMVRLAVEVEIALAGSMTYGRTQRGAGRAETGADGTFVIDGLGAGEHGLHVSADGMQPLRRQIVISAASADPMVIRLEPGLALTGRVEDADGNAVAGARVGAGPASQSMDDPRASHSFTESDGDGGFVLEGLASGPHTVFARSEESGQTVLASAEAGQADEVVLRFPRGAAINGSVVGPDGSPAGGAQVWASGGANRQFLRTQTGPDGRYELENAGPGSWRVRASAEGFAPANEEVEISEGVPATVDFRLERGAVVVGRVEGLLGSELERTVVQAGGASSVQPSSDGSFRIEGVPPGPRQVTASEMTSRRSRSVTVEVPESGESEMVVMDFASGLSLYGRVLRGGAGAPGIRVALVGVAAAASSETLSGSDGKWRVEGLEPGEYQVAAYSQSGGVIAGDHVILEVDTELDLVVATGTITGRVLDAGTERPVEGASVVVDGSSLPVVHRELTTDARGVFSVEELGEGEFLVKATAKEYMPAQEIVSLAEGGERDVTLLLENAAATVLVVTDVNGAPARNISVRTLSGGLIGPLLSTRCGSGGRCPIDDLPRGRWTLLILAEGAALRTVDLPAEEVPVQLRRTGKVGIRPPAETGDVAWQVRLVEAATGIVVPVLDWLSFSPGRPEWATVSNRGLDFSVPEGIYRLEIFAPDGEISARDVTVPAGGEITVQLE